MKIQSYENVIKKKGLLSVKSRVQTFLEDDMLMQEVRSYSFTS